MALGKKYLIRLTFFSLGACQKLWCPQNTHQSLSSIFFFFLHYMNEKSTKMQSLVWKQTKPVYTMQCFPRGKKKTSQQLKRSSISDILHNSSLYRALQPVRYFYTECFLFISFYKWYADDVWDGIILKLCPIYALNDMSLCKLCYLGDYFFQVMLEDASKASCCSEPHASRVGFATFHIRFWA